MGNYPAHEIEITPEMIEAGMVALRSLEYDLWEGRSPEKLSILVDKIYRTMHSAALPTGGSPTMSDKVRIQTIDDLDAYFDQYDIEPITGKRLGVRVTGPGFDITPEMERALTSHDYMLKLLLKTSLRSAQRVEQISNHMASPLNGLWQSLRNAFRRRPA